MEKQLAQHSTFIHKKVGNRMICVFNEKAQEIQNTISLGHIVFQFPLFFGGWSIDSFLGKFLVQHLLENPPRTILKLGSGSSTLLIARCMDVLGHKDRKHIAVDHEDRYLDMARSRKPWQGNAVSE